MSGCKQYFQKTLAEANSTTTAESLDLEDPGNPFLLTQFSSYYSPTRTVRWLERFFVFLFAFFLAIVVACIVKFIEWAADGLLEYRFELLSELMTEGVDLRPESSIFATGPLWGQAYGIAVGLSIAIVLIPALLIMTLYPAAAGPGVPELISFLNGSKMDKYYRMSTLILKLFGLIAIIGAGLFSGVDGPVAHIGAILAIETSNFLSPLWIHWRRKLSGSELEDAANVQETNPKRAQLDESYLLRVDRSRHAISVASLGSAAGVTAAFRSPLGGVAFCLEEAITHFSPSIIIRTLFVTTVTYVMSLLLSIDGKYPGFGFKSFALYPTNASSCTLKTSLWSIIIAIVMGLVFGVLGHVYNRSVLFIKQWRHEWVTKNTKTGQRVWKQSTDLLIVICITMSLVLFVPLSPSFQNCTPRSAPLVQMFGGVDAANCILMCTNGTSSLSPLCPFQTKPQLETEDGTSLCVPDESKQFILFYIYNTATLYEDMCRENPTGLASLPLFAGDQSAEFALVAAGWLAPHLRWGYASQMEEMATSEKETRQESNPNDPPVCYYQMQSLLWNPPGNILRNLMLRGLYDLFTPAVLGVFIVVYTFLSMLIYGIALPTDLIMPNLIVGAALGRLFGLGLNALVNVLNRTNPLLVDPGAYAVLGMAGLWAGVARLPLTVILVTVESTGDVNVLPRLCIIVVVATLMGEWLGPSLYHLEIERRRMLYLSPEIHRGVEEMEKECVSTIMSRDMVVLPAVASKRYIWTILQQYKHSGFPVMVKMLTSPSASNNPLQQEEYLQKPILDDERTWQVPTVLQFDKHGTPLQPDNYQCVGIILRAALEMQLFAKEDISRAAFNNTRRRRHEIEHVASYVAEAPDSPANLRPREASLLTQIDDDVPINLLPLVNFTPATITAETSMLKAINTFRDLKLRHLLVTRGVGQGGICGILTRRDFVMAVERLESNEHLENVKHEESTNIV
jgi:H+/Cl- antiporter ClcA